MDIACQLTQLQLLVYYLDYATASSIYLLESLQLLTFKATSQAIANMVALQIEKHDQLQ